MQEHFLNLLVYAIPVIFAITLHEAAHAYIAKFCGDNTAYAAGRMSLNPMVHIDPLGTIVMPALLYLLFGVAFGYAKPVPVDFSRLRHPRRDMAWVALAGPGANFIMALMWMIFGLLLSFFQVTELFPHKVAQAGVVANLVILALNLIPIPPLDGGRILTSMLPPRLGYRFAQIEPYGIMIVFALLSLRLLNWWLIPVMTLTNDAVALLASPLNALLF
jgi:Zn-dependent protease